MVRNVPTLRTAASPCTGLAPYNTLLSLPPPLLLVCPLTVMSWKVMCSVGFLGPNLLLMMYPNLS